MIDLYNLETINSIKEMFSESTGSIFFTVFSKWIDLYKLKVIQNKRLNKVETFCIPQDIL